ncbi:hypothetical protein TNCV_5034291 [Trichonephila clavipes]|nr:hypothetical protein TNCV_5034291 [Trichonephila clavipes]
MEHRRRDGQVCPDVEQESFRTWSRRRCENPGWRELGKSPEETRVGRWRTEIGVLLTTLQCQSSCRSFDVFVTSELIFTLQWCPVLSQTNASVIARSVERKGRLIQKADLRQSSSFHLSTYWYD